MKKVNPGLILAVAVLAAACSSNCKDEGTCECISRFDCNDDKICIGGKCVDDDERAWIVAERKFGEPCIANRECIKGFCLPIGPDNGGVCTVSCENTEDCQEGWTCKTWTVGSGNADNTEDIERVCVQNTASRLCMKCAVDGHCNATGDLCVELPDGHVCAEDCSASECPTGYECKEVTRENGSFAQCLPLDDSCECGPGKEGMGKSCTNSNEYGVCAGWSYCTEKDGEYAWSECEAQVPGPEICNGLDDDCDGLIDSFDPGLSYSELENADIYPLCYLGGCLGRWQCRADEENNISWDCDAGDPERELCNGADDNCNGAIDEAFRDNEGNYVHVDHCGTCGASCALMLPNLRKDESGAVIEGAATCELRDGKPTCIPVLCAEGFYPYPHENPISCIKLESPACEVCGADSDCRVYSDKCMSLDGDFGTHCLQSCAEDSPYGCTGTVGQQGCCPTGYTCKFHDGGKWCIPKGESCTCDQSKVDMVRNCAVASDVAVCQGRQTCEKTGSNTFAWSECSAQDVTNEVCDGQDNNCDGNVDEDFVDEYGRYNTDEHCGECNNDCPSRWKAPELHATGACLLENRSYQCKFTGCKRENIVTGKRCGEDADCAKGMKCDRQFYYCVAESGDTPQVSCSSDSDCRSIDIAHRCVSGICQVNMQYHDVNKIDADGCECGEAVDGGGDEPEIFGTYPTELSNYIDRDCDGIDGNAASSLFVSAQTTSSEGTRENPYATISEAIAAFDASKHKAILVAAGSYLEQVELKSGIQLYGGYSPDFSARNIVLYTTQVAAPPTLSDTKPGSVYIPAVNRTTVMSGFVISGYNSDESTVSAGAPGRNSYAVYMAQASSKILLVNNDIRAGRAGNGGRGEIGKSGNAGDDGQAGKNSRECSSTMCIGETTKGGAGGTNSTCRAANGRDGATARDGGQSQDFMYSSLDGQGGQNNSYEHSSFEQYDFCKYDCMSGGYANGENGHDGNIGLTGNQGQSCTRPVGRVNRSIWVGMAGVSGETGGAGNGGGGGGAGGGANNYNPYGCTQGNLVGDIGGSGGGGGAGGCGGYGGQAGGAGGGAFGIWIAEWNSDARIYGNKIQLGFGGAGGDGGDGGAGGKGGRGGVGGKNISPAWCSGAGGSGGNGGDGGAGGGGGGGCGGVSIGIAGVQIPTSFQDNNQFSYPEGGEKAAAGPGGSAGNSPAASSPSTSQGKAGFTALVYAF